MILATDFRASTAVDFEYDLKPINQTEKGKTTNMKAYLLSILICCATSTAALAATLDTAKIDQITGLKGKMRSEEHTSELQSH